MRGRSFTFFSRHGPALFDAAVLAALLGLLAHHIPPSLLITDTMTVGGDTPAHNYLASHLKNQLFHHGRIVSWAPGWWCGFPLFQYYFSLPYLLMALLSLLVPFNVAFKLISVLGIAIMPPATWQAARMLRLPRPVPVLAAIAATLFLFDPSHTMWGGNIYSTLAGMISNSLSFPIMLLAIASCTRDASDGVFRVRTVLLMYLLLASHFFTSVIAGFTLAVLPLLLARGCRLRALATLARHGLLAGLLISWWLLPLVCKQPYSVDFGVNWDVALSGTLPLVAGLMTPLAVVALVISPRECRASIFLVAWMLLIATVLFRFGFGLSNVFVNVRLWPFVFFALLFLSATGLGLLIRRLRATPLLISAFVIVLVVFVDGQQRGPLDGYAPIRDWVRFNYEGLENKPEYRVVRDLVLPLNGTPGRLANDLTEANNAVGSTRIFEAVPHLIDKPILEGGLVSSGLSSLFSYYVQGEISQTCAGFPTIVTPTTFNLTNGTRHLELMNVKHMIAHWPKLRRALAIDPRWRFVDAAGDWELFELTTHEGRYVTIPEFLPVAVTTDRWQAYALEWFYRLEAIEQPFVFQPAGRASGDPELSTVLSESEFRQYLQSVVRRAGDIDEWLHLGPFYFEPDIGAPLDLAPISEHGLDPVEGDAAAAHHWDLLFSRSPIFPGRRYQEQEYMLTYHFVNVFSPDERDALLHYGNDDSVRILLNDEQVVHDRITGPDNLRSVTIHLRAGRNRLLHKLEQTVGGQFFHVRITDTDGTPFEDVRFGVDRDRPSDAWMQALKPTPARRGAGVVSEDVGAHSIRFRTEAIGLPHLIKCSYFPNWKVRGARAVHMVTPTFMLVYPRQPEIELYYGATLSDITGMALTGLGGLWLLWEVFVGRTRRRGRRKMQPVP